MTFFDFSKKLQFCWFFDENFLQNLDAGMTDFDYSITILLRGSEHGNMI
jgi:hypothetical protein